MIQLWNDDFVHKDELYLYRPLLINRVETNTVETKAVFKERLNWFLCVAASLVLPMAFIIATTLL